MLFCCHFVSGLYPENPRNKVYHIIFWRTRGEGEFGKNWGMDDKGTEKTDI